MGSESAARLGAAQDAAAKKRRAFIVVEENMKHFKEVLGCYITEANGDNWGTYSARTQEWAESALKAVNQ